MWSSVVQPRRRRLPQRLPAEGQRRQHGQRQATFVDKCAARHTLARANATGTSGPNLDAAFAQSREDGLGESTFEGIVHQQILHPNRNPQQDPTAKGKTRPACPPPGDGNDARDIAAYVARPPPSRARTRASSRPSARRPRARRRRRTGRWTSRSRPGLAYKFADAEANAGSVKVTSENAQPSATTSRSTATGSTRRALSSRAAPPRSPPISSPASTRSSAPSPATAKVAWKASSPSSRAARGV